MWLGAAQSRELALTQRPAGVGSRLLAQRRGPLQHAMGPPEDVQVWPPSAVKEVDCMRAAASAVLASCCAGPHTGLLYQ